MGGASFDSVHVIEPWVEKGPPPTQMVASHLAAGQTDRTHPLCTYPQVARYKGSGSIDEAVNFMCTSNQ
jgi:feruloyl esterase